MTSDHQDEPEEHGYGLVMPFVACASQGGEYPDEAFVAGFDCGQLWAELSDCKRLHALPIDRFVKTGIVRQIDLIAMHYEFAVTFGEEETPGWRLATFVRPEAGVTPAQ